MTSNGSETTQKIDYFSLLPNELVGSIANEHNHRFGQDPIPLISKRFLPHHRAQLYSSVNISTPFQLAAFFETLSTAPHLGELVESLHLMLPNGTTADLAIQTSLIQFDDETLKDCLKTLTRVEYCNIEQSIRISRLAIQLENPLSLEMMNLYVTLSGNDFPDIFDPDNFRHLPKFPFLRDFSITAVDQPFSVDPSKRSNLPPPDLSPIDSLSLDGKLSNAHISQLIECCRPLGMPILNSDSGEGILTALKAVKSPWLIQELILRGQSQLPPSEYLQCLNKFVSIKTLILTRGCVPLDPSFYRYLRQLPLEDLTFDYRSRLSSSGVLSLVKGSSRVESLEQLQLDHVFAAEGTYVTSREDNDWMLPDWEGEVRRSQCEAVREAGDRVGVEVTGKALEAMEIEDRFEEIIASLRIED